LREKAIDAQQPCGDRQHEQHAEVGGEKKNDALHGIPRFETLQGSLRKPSAK
jgi:hypothetical protein